MSSIFSKIAAGEIPSYKVAADEKHFAFLDINPMTAGHVLVIPRKETDYIFDLDPEAYADLMLFARRVALAIGKAIPCKRVAVAVLGMEVPHAHVHLVPIISEGDLDFKAPKLSIPSEEMQNIADKIASEFK